MARSSYKAPDYDENKYRQGIDTSFYQNAVNQYTKDAEMNRARQLGEAQKTQQAQLKQAYINRVQNQNQLNNNMAMAGIRGGATESSNIKLANIYGQARAAANTDYANSVNTINQNIDDNIRDYRMDMESRAEEYRQNQANARWQAEREDSLNEWNSAVEYWNNYYLDRYSGYSKKQAQKELKRAKKLLKNAKNQTQRIRYEQMVRGLSNRLGVIANK